MNKDNSETETSEQRQFRTTEKGTRVIMNRKLGKGQMVKDQTEKGQF